MSPLCLTNGSNSHHNCTVVEVCAVSHLLVLLHLPYKGKYSHHSCSWSVCCGPSPGVPASRPCACSSCRTWCRGRACSPSAHTVNMMGPSQGNFCVWNEQCSGAAWFKIGSSFWQLKKLSDSEFRLTIIPFLALKLYLGLYNVPMLAPSPIKKARLCNTAHNPVLRSLPFIDRSSTQY